MPLANRPQRQDLPPRLSGGLQQVDPLAGCGTEIADAAIGGQRAHVRKYSARPILRRKRRPDCGSAVVDHDYLLRGEGEGRRVSQLPEGVAHVRDEVIDQRPAPHLAAAFLDREQTAQLALRDVVRLLGKVELGTVGVEEVGHILIADRDLRHDVPLHDLLHEQIAPQDRDHSRRFISSPSKSAL